MIIVYPVCLFLWLVTNLLGCHGKIKFYKMILFSDSSSKTTIKAVLQTSLLLYEDSQ